MTSRTGLIGGLVACAAMAFCSLCLAVQQPKQAVSAPNPPPDIRGTKGAPLIVETVEGPNDAAERDSAAKHREQEATNSRFTMIFTGAMVIIAVLQAFLFLIQLKLMRKSLVDTTIAAKAAEAAAKLARDEFTASHRPRLIVRREELRFTPEHQGINLVIANVGDTPATRITADVNIKILPLGDGSLTRESMPPYSGHQIDISQQFKDGGGSAELKAGARVFVFFQLNELNQEAWDALTNNRQTLYFFGNVTFYDSVGTARDSAFFRIYNSVSRKFSPVSDDPDYEYN